MALVMRFSCMRHYRPGTPSKNASLKNERAKRRGFSLIEIIVVMTILAILVSILVTTMANYAVKQRFDGVITDVYDGLHEVRRNTLGSVNDTLYGVHVSSTAVVFFEGTDFVEGAVSNELIALPGSLIASTSFSNNQQTATFTRLTGIPSATGTIMLTDDTHNRQATITISSTGLVE
ncbi:type II secretion system GspH family protein [Candidatus Pacebacteria bacterium]|nr:type II secretion system GspH family protein [Candidatus Paceibacterota bacterium]